MFSKPSLGQKYLFSPTGVMDMSRFYVDTVVKTKLKANGKIMFNYLDSVYIDSMNVKQLFIKKYNEILKDTIEYFFVANLTNKSIRFKKLDNRLVAEEFGLHDKLGFRPVSFFSYPSCGTGINYDDLVIKSSEVLIIKCFNKRINLDSKSKTNCFAKLLTSTNGVIVSVSYPRVVNNNSFYVNSKHVRYFDNKNRFAFLDK
jgi:hypothetical protein